MKVLFVSSGNSAGGMSAIVESQGESLRDIGIQIDYFSIQGKGAAGYLRNVPKLRRFLKLSNYDLIHSHYSLSSFVAALAAGGKPIISSFMGSDVYHNTPVSSVVKALIRRRCNTIIVKTEAMKKRVGIDGVLVIPNGVDLKQFYPMTKQQAQESLGWRNDLRHILFAADPDRNEKNYQLAEKAISFLNSEHFELHYLKGVPHHDTVRWYTASDITLLTSIYEGSPNVIKEAMACNCPIVSTDVGDVSWLFGDLEGHFISSFEPEDVAENIQLALNYGRRTNGRKRIMELGLDSASVAKRIMEVYRTVLKTNEV